MMFKPRNPLTPSELAATRRRYCYESVRQGRLLTPEEAIAARPDLPPLKAIATDHRLLRDVLADEAASPLQPGSTGGGGPESESVPACP